jgi:chemotaxis protein methyltransferase CheR
MTISAIDFDYISKLVMDDSAISLPTGKEYLAESRLAPVARKEGFTSIEQLIAHLRPLPRNPLHRKVVEAMTTNETSFFRDIHPFETLRTRVLPELLARGRGRTPLQIWSAAASTGQEAYSIAMVLREDFPELVAADTRILATDINTAVLERVREGLYSQLEVSRGLPAPQMLRHFDKVGMEWRARPDLRRMIDSQQMNLATTWPAIPTMDVVFMRNVLIYFDTDVKKAILGRIRKVLARGGYLFLGGAETTIGVDDSFERVQIDRTICYRAISR